MSKDYELIEHTADIGIRVQAADLAELFSKAASAMFDIMTERAKTGSKEAQLKISLAAPSVEELLVDWLNELLSLSAVKKLVFTAFTFTEISERRLEAGITGAALSDFTPSMEIKAATYHGLSTERTPDGSWKAEVIFDV